MNVLVIAGRLGFDAESRVTPAGTAVSGFNVAVDVGYGDKKETMWVKCSLWGRKGEGQPHGLTPYLLKGGYVVVTGEVSLQQWQTDGETKSQICCNVKNVSLGGGERKDMTNPPAQKPQVTGSASPPPSSDFGDFDDSIPF